MASTLEISKINQYSVNITLKACVVRKTPVKTAGSGKKYFYFAIKDNSAELQCCCFEENKFDEIEVGQWYLISNLKFGLNKYSKKLESTVNRDTTLQKTESNESANVESTEYTSMYEILEMKQNGDTIDFAGVFHTEGVIKKVRVKEGTVKNKFYAQVTDGMDNDHAIYINAWESNIPTSWKRGQRFTISGATVVVYNGTKSLNIENGSSFKILDEEENDAE